MISLKNLENEIRNKVSSKFLTKKTVSPIAGRTREAPRVATAVNNFINSPVNQRLNKYVGPNSTLDKSILSFMKPSVELGRRIGDVSVRNARTPTSTVLKDMVREVVPQAARVGAQVGLTNKALTTPAGLKTTGVVAGLNTGISSLKRGSLKEGVRETVENTGPTLQRGGMYSVSNPLWDKAARTIGATKFIPRNAIAGAGNIVEDEITSRLLKIDPDLTNQDRLVSFLAPGVFDGAGIALKEGSNVLKSLFGSASDEVIKQVGDGKIIAKIGDIIGIEDKRGRKLAYDTKTNRFVPIPTIKKKIKDITTFSVMGKEQEPFINEREITTPAFGAVAGIEPETDEEGNITGLSFDPVKGVAGVAVMGGVKAVKDLPGKQASDLVQEARKYKNAEEFIKAQGTPKTVSVWNKSKFSNEGAYADIPVIRKEENITLYQGGKTGDGRQFWTPDKKYAEQFGDVKEKTGSFYKIDNGNRVTDVYVEAPTKSQLTDIWNQANNVMADVGGKERGFITTLKDSPKTDPRVAGELEGAYIPQTNEATLKTAKDNLKNDFTGAVRRAVDLNESLTPESVAEGHLLIDMLSKKGDIESAVSVAEALAEKGTKQGQIVQAFSMWDRLTPEGMLTYAQRAVNKANEGRGTIDNMLGRDNIKLSPEDAQEILKTMQDAQKVPVSERGAYTKKALEVINKAIPPSTSELFDAYRYEGMLSNPRTQLRNIHGNLLQTFVTRPMTMAFETPFDWMQSTLFGAERKRYLSDVPEYYRDVVNSIPLGAEAFMKSMKGSLPVDKPDLESVRKISGPVSRFMEGMDKFNQTIIGGAIKNDLMSKGMSEGEALEQAQKQAEYWLFRQKADPKNLTGQGYLLSAVDKLSSSISGLPGRKWFIPFIQTPTNVAKQFLEFSPAGLATIPGNKNPVEQLAKTSAGTVAMLIGAKLAAEGRLSWAAPTSPEDKAIFYETRKPFSVKVGDTWVPMQYFGPFALALALPAAYEYYDKVEKKSLTSTQAQKAYNTILNSFQFMTNQTFLTGLNNYVQVLSGDPDYSFPSSAGFTATQAVPYSGLLRYISTIVDPTMRKSKKFMDSFYTTIPGMSDKAFPYLDPMGQPVQRDPINYITPYDIKESDPFYERIYQGNVKTSQSDDIRNFSSRIRAIGRDPTLSIEEKRSKILAEERKMKTARENINKLEGSR